MTEAMPFLQKYDITFLRPLPIHRGRIIIRLYSPLLSDTVRFSPS